MNKMTGYVSTYILKWMLLSAFIGIGGGLSALVLDKAVEFASLGGDKLPLFLAPVIGGVLVTLISKADREVLGSGSPNFIKSVNVNYGDIKRKTWVTKLLASAATIGFKGSGGMEGPMLMMGGSWANLVSKIPFTKRFLDKEDRRVLTISGAAAAVGAIFSSPLGGGIFAVELLYKSSLHYTELFPAILASTVGFIVSAALGDSDPMFSMIDYQTNPRHIFYYVLASILAGYISVIFLKIYKSVEKAGDRFANRGIEQYLPILGGILTGIVIWFIPEVGGTGASFIQALIDESMATPILILILVGKMAATSFTVGFRGSAGLVIPAMFFGAMSGGMISDLFSVTIPGLHNALIAAGMAAALASIANVPIAASVIIIEMIGFEVGGSAVVGSVIGFLVGHHQMIYSGFKHDETTFKSGEEYRMSDRYLE